MSQQTGVHNASTCESEGYQVAWGLDLAIGVHRCVKCVHVHTHNTHLHTYHPLLWGVLLHWSSLVGVVFGQQRE